MGSIFSQLRSVRRFLSIFSILFRQFIVLWPYRTLVSPSSKSRKLLGPYLMPATGGPEIAKETLQKLGPTYIKFGQFMSIRPDLIPPEFCAAFKGLQDNVPPFPFAQFKKELNSELKRPYTEIFSEFEETPLAAASIAQVHRARLATGEAVAVKVQRPGIREAMASDIIIMQHVAGLLERFVPSLRKHEPVALVREFSRWTDRELYFRQEGKNALHFSYNFRNYPCVHIPKVFREYTTRKILVMEHVQGVNILHARDGDIDRKEVARLIVDSMMKQIFIDGFFHGDPHAGNILLVGKNEIAYLDFGIVGHLSGELRAWIFDILYGMSQGDVDRVIASFLEMCNVREQDGNLAAYRREMNEILSELQIYEAAGIPFSDMMKRFLYTSLAFGIPIPHEFILVTKALTTFEGTCLTLDPEITIIQHLRAFVRKHIAKPPSFDEVLERFVAGPFELERMKRLVVKHGTRVVSFLENPEIRIRDEAQTRGRENPGMDIASGIIIAALILLAGSGKDSALDQWLRAALSMPDLPALPLISLASAVGLWMWLLSGRGNGRNKGRDE